MSKQQFLLAMTWLKKYMGSINAARIMKLITWITAIYYGVTLIYLCLSGDDRLLQVIIVPGVSFAVVTVFRKLVHAKRPYEKYEFEPLVAKESTGNSFPSRHVFSCFVIATQVYIVWPEMGILLFVCGVILGFIRVMSGIHFPSDVIAGALVGILSGVIGNYIF